MNVDALAAAGQGAILLELSVVPARGRAGRGAPQAGAGGRSLGGVGLGPRLARRRCFGAGWAASSVARGGPNPWCGGCGERAKILKACGSIKFSGGTGCPSDGPSGAEAANPHGMQRSADRLHALLSPGSVRDGCECGCGNSSLRCLGSRRVTKASPEPQRFPLRGAREPASACARLPDVSGPECRCLGPESEAAR